jgi:hypothetical protein
MVLSAHRWGEQRVFRAFSPLSRARAPACSEARNAVFSGGCRASIGANRGNNAPSKEETRC